MSLIASALGECGGSGVAVLASAGAARRRLERVTENTAISIPARRLRVRITFLPVRVRPPQRWALGFYKRPWPSVAPTRRYVSDSGGGVIRGGAGRGLRVCESSGSGAAPCANAAPSPATAAIASDAPAGSSSSLLASPAATAGSASRYL